MGRLLQWSSLSAADPVSAYALCYSTCMSENTSRPEVAHIAALHRTVTDEAELIARDLDLLAMKVREAATKFSPNPKGDVDNSEQAHAILSMISAHMENQNLSLFHHRAASLDVLIAAERGAQLGWGEGRSSVAEDLTSPLDAGGMRRVSTNPHQLPPVQAQGNLLDDVALILKHSVFSSHGTPGDGHDSWTMRARSFQGQLDRVRGIADERQRAAMFTELGSFALDLLASGDLARTAPTHVRVLMNARRPGLRELLTGDQAELS